MKAVKAAKYLNVSTIFLGEVVVSESEVPNASLAPRSRMF
jgi:hypothetical protein